MHEGGITDVFKNEQLFKCDVSKNVLQEILKGKC